MSKEKTYQFEDFLSEVGVDNREFVANIHAMLAQDGYKCKIELKASGFFVSYSHPKTKRSMLNFLFRKNGLFTRIYADNVIRYADFLNRLPEKMEKEINKAPVCKRLINPEDCNLKCITGYDFSVKDNRYRKCRYQCFQFSVNPDSRPVLISFIEKERKERALL
jgi:hypothetical protein